MYCVIYIDSDKEISDFENQLSTYFGNTSKTADIFRNTSLSGSGTVKRYFYGNTNQAVNFLFAQESSHKLRIFIEKVATRDNLDQLTSGVKVILSQTITFSKKNKIALSNITATIWAEEEEMIRGDIPNYWVQFRGFIPEIATSVYLSTLVVIYSFIAPKAGSGFIDSIINLGLIALAVLIWLLVKTGLRKKELIYKIK